MIGGPPLSAEDRARVARFGEIAGRLRVEIAQRLLGQDAVVDQVLTAFFAGGHVLLVGVPGLGKTMLVRALGEALTLRASRIQFTPDLMPSDITGTEILVEHETTGAREMRFQPGPVFAHLLLADEINRTPPKTQAALIEAMEELQVTTSGHRHPVEAPFFVMATQNPIEQEGTYPLPAAQLDRFMLKIDLPYPDFAIEARIGRLTATAGLAPISAIVSRDEVLEIHALVRRLPIPETVARHALAIVRATRPSEPSAPPFVRDWVSWGAGPRAVQWLLIGASARAVLAGRTEASEADVRTLARPVMRHRLVPNFRAEAENVSADTILGRLLETFPGSAGPEAPAAAPRGRWRQVLASLGAR